MSARSVFHNDAGLLRPPWRIAVFCVASIVGVVLAAVFLEPIVSFVFQLTGIRGVSSEWIVEAAGLLAGTAISIHRVDKRPWSDVWLGREAARPSLLLFGFTIGALAIGIPIVLLIAVHWLREIPGGTASWWGGAVRVSLMLAPAALLEELMTRGYILSVLREWLGWKWAVVGTSIGFGLLHLANNGVTVRSVMLVIVAGFFLAGVLYATQSLYAAWMAHFAWNWMMAVVFHTAVSGYPLESPRYRYVDAGPDWATGGEWGPEGGLPAGAGMGVGLVYLFARRARTSRRQEL